MDGLIGMMVVIYVVYSISKAAKSMKTKQQAASGKRPAEARPASAAASPNSGGGRSRVAAHSSGAAAAAVAKPAQAAVQPLGEGMSTMSHSLQMRMESTLQPRPRKTEYVGSLGVSSAEGEDVCDPSLGHGDAHAGAAFAPGSVYEDEIGGETLPGWNGQEIARGVVMSEVLKRPWERKWGRAAAWRN